MTVTLSPTDYSSHQPLSPRLRPTRRGHDVASIARQLLEGIGENPEREGLRETPDRFARAIRRLTSGYDQDPRDVVGSAIFEESTGSLVVVRNIEFYSMCEHHLLPFFGRMDVAYVPDGRVVGLSKVPRLIEVFARRLQLQERLTDQVAEAVDDVLAPKGVAVIAEASHLCMMMRGVEKQQSTTVTTAVRGTFVEDAASLDRVMRLMSDRSR